MGTDRIPGLTDRELEAMVREAIARNRMVRRDSAAQEVVDRCVEGLFAEGELMLAAGLLFLDALRVLDREHEGLLALYRHLEGLDRSGALVRRCRACGRVEERADPDRGDWVTIDLCSACDRRLRAATVRAMGPGPGRDG
jgi:hypothetical protein